VFEKFRAEWRRGRALKTLKPGERQYWEWDSKTDAGTLCAYLRFDADGDVLTLTFFEIWGKDPERVTYVGTRQGVPRAELGLKGAFGFVGVVADLAVDGGFSRLRFTGQRTRRRRKEAQNVEFDLARFRRGRGAAR
jgi:hypothetical protein